jgi:hypothetical protein
METINTNRIKVSAFSAELPNELNRDLRTLVTAEVDIYDVGTPTNDNGTHDRVFKAKLVGSVIVQQKGVKDTYVCKSKRSPSERLRACIPDENYYEICMNKLINNWETIKETIKSL